MSKRKYTNNEELKRKTLGLKKGRNQYKAECLIYKPVSNFCKHCLMLIKINVTKSRTSPL